MERKSDTNKPLFYIVLQNFDIVFQPTAVNQTDHYMQYKYDAKPAKRKQCTINLCITETLLKNHIV